MQQIVFLLRKRAQRSSAVHLKALASRDASEAPEYRGAPRVPISTTSASEPARALPPDARSEGDDGRGSDAEHLPELVGRRRDKKHQRSQSTIGVEDAHVRGQP